MLKKILTKFVASQTFLCRLFDSIFLPQSFRIDGNWDFVVNILPQSIPKNARVYDVGGGKNPFISLAQKQHNNIKLVGLDIDANELNAAPQGLYDEIIQADIAHYQGSSDADLVVCQCLLEHVANTPRALQGIASCLEKDGRALLFVPSSRAVFAKLNRLLSEAWKKKLLYSIFPSTKKDQGFLAYYHECSPQQMIANAKAVGLGLREVRYYFMSAYFRWFFPLHCVWRLWQLLRFVFLGKEAAETFCLTLYKE